MVYLEQSKRKKLEILIDFAAGKAVAKKILYFFA